MSKPKILLAESSNIVLQIEKRYLGEAGVSIFTAADSENALRVVRKIKPDLIYLAFNLQGMGGVSCCQVLKSDPGLAEIPVVMVCAAAGEEQLLSRAAGCDAVVTKPIDRREFLEAGLSLVPKTAPLGERMLCRAVAACLRGNEVFYGTIEDISSNGMFIGTPHEVEVGDFLTVTFVLPWSGALPVEAGAQVNWVNGSKRRRNTRLPPGFGVLFQGLDDESIAQIKDYMDLIRLQMGW